MLKQMKFFINTNDPIVRWVFSQYKTARSYDIVVPDDVVIGANHIVSINFKFSCQLKTRWKRNARPFWIVPQNNNMVVLKNAPYLHDSTSSKSIVLTFWNTTNESIIITQGTRVAQIVAPNLKKCPLILI